jgi:hypothetical protein
LQFLGTKPGNPFCSGAVAVLLTAQHYIYKRKRETERFYYVFFNWGVDVKDLGKQKGEK